MNPPNGKMAFSKRITPSFFGKKTFTLKAYRYCDDEASMLNDFCIMWRVLVEVYINRRAKLYE
jgi:hypothetical protein